MMVRYRATVSGSPIDSVDNKPQRGAWTEGLKQNRVTKLWPRFLHQRATLAATTLFLLVLSGPPKFRFRDPEASLRGDTDWVVILHVAVWALAGLWVLLQIGRRLNAKRPLLRLSLPLILGLVMILCLTISAVVSNAPALSAFKIYQMAVALLLVQLFVECFGPASCLKTIFWGTALLCGTIAVCAFLAPDFVWVGSDFNPDPSRLRGDLIAPTGPVAAVAIILLLTGIRKTWRVIPLALLGLFLWLAVFSLMRTAYVVVLGFFVLVLVKRPNAKSLNQLAYLGGAFALTLYACHWMPHLSEYRDPETISSLSDRIGLWRHLSDVTLTQSPWFGLGYYSASRIYGPEYNPGLGTAHSMFFEILLGGGVPSFVLFTALCLILSVYAASVLYKNRDRLSLAIASLFFASLIFGSMGDVIDSGPVAIYFWYSVAVLPWLYKRSSIRATRPDQSFQTATGDVGSPKMTIEVS
jgi:O-antigen ligase